MCHILPLLLPPILPPGPSSAFCAYRGRLKGGGTDNIAMTARTCTFSPSAPSSLAFWKGMCLIEIHMGATNKPPAQWKQKQCDTNSKRVYILFCEMQVGKS